MVEEKFQMPQVYAHVLKVYTKRLVDVLSVIILNILTLILNNACTARKIKFIV